MKVRPKRIFRLTHAKDRELILSHRRQIKRWYERGIPNECRTSGLDKCIAIIETVNVRKLTQKQLLLINAEYIVLWEKLYGQLDYDEEFDSSLNYMPISQFKQDKIIPKNKLSTLGKLATKLCEQEKIKWYIRQDRDGISKQRIYPEKILDQALILIGSNNG